MKKKFNNSLILVLIILIPLVFVGFFEKIKFIKELTPEYLGFLSSYVSSLIVLGGVFITINYNKKQDYENYRLTKLPYIEVDYIKGLSPNKTSSSIIFSDSENTNHQELGYLVILNNGFGPALDFKITNISFNYQDLQFSISSDKILKVEESIYILVWGNFNIENINGKSIDDRNRLRGLKPLYFDVVYKDFLGNEYVDEYILNYTYIGEYDSNGQGVKLELTTWPLKKEKSRMIRMKV